MPDSALVPSGVGVRDAIDDTVRELQDAVVKPERPQDAETVLALELATDDRTTAKNLILQRIEALET